MKENIKELARSAVSVIVVGTLVGLLVYLGEGILERMSFQRDIDLVIEEIQRIQAEIDSIGNECAR